MKKIDIIRPSSINAIIGPVGTLKRMLGNREYFEEHGYDLTVFTYDTINEGGIKTPPPSESIRAYNPTTSLGGKLKYAVSHYIWKWARICNLFAFYLIQRERNKIKKLVKKYINQNRNVDVVQFHSNLEAYYYLKYRKDKSARTIMFLHTDGYPYKMILQYYPKLENSWYFRQYKKQYEWTVNNVDRIGFIAKAGQKNFLKFFPSRTLEDTSVIINGITDLTPSQKQEFDVLRVKSEKAPSFKYRMCCTGTINSRKGHRIIIEAINKLDNRLKSQIHVDFLGEGAERPDLESLVKKYGLDENITFHGFVPNVDVYKYLAKNNIYILMSKNEGLPISIIEAMRASMMVISTNVSGIPELIDHGYNGFLLEPSENDLVKALLELPGTDIMSMGIHSRMRYESEFTFARMEKEFCDMYDTEFIKQ